jgi:predicted ATPase
MPRVIVTGGPGAGNTTLLAEFARLGFQTISDSAREVIAERLARGESPRPDQVTFSREILRRDREKYRTQSDSAGWIFFDRSPLEALAMVHEAVATEEADPLAKLNEYRFHSTVFLLPPWQAIYQTDAERDHSFAHAEHVYASLVRWYRLCGYALHEVPRCAVAERAKHVLQVLASSEA